MNQSVRHQAARLREQVEGVGLSVPGSPSCARPRRWGGLTLGGRAPVIATATTAGDPGAAAEQALAAARAGADVVELRLDLLEAPAPCAVTVPAGQGGVSRAPALAAFYLETTTQVTSALTEGGWPVPLLLTVRTAAEGGALEVSDTDYAVLLAAVLAGLAERRDAGPAGAGPTSAVGAVAGAAAGAGTGPGAGGAAQVVAVDVELARGCLPRLAAAAGMAGVDVVASTHFFDRTPPREEISGLLAAMQAAGADVAKVAVMPREDADVLTLLVATSQARASLDVPLVTMSMGERGVVTRLAGGVFGSALTFATAGGQASAPGQPPIQAVRSARTEVGLD